ncbi:uberolysin/carnocyclin family circular bacteriocin [Jeotgalibacillus marinus]|uniref:Uberolysin/carnocyclin family circular bacteriocin n=1 Tax=Jeotgalibacillus marinus TaxID=86667 RepID=A0ABV3Q3L9_9BACL
MSLTSNKKQMVYVLGVSMALALLVVSFPLLAANLGISTAVAGVIITTIDTYSTIATIVSLLGVIVGYGVVSTALVITAKQVIAKFGTGYATTW